MKQKFIYKYEEIEGVEGEKTILKELFNLPMGYVEVLITLSKEGKEEYYNLYIIDEHFKKEPMNCLKEQIPADKETYKLFSKMFLECRALEHYLWFKYGNPSKDEVLSFGIEVYN